MASTTSGDVLPTGGRIFTSIPDLFFIPEFVFGGLVWILVASTRVVPDNPLGWVMFVSVFCFVVTTLWFFIFLCGGNQSSIWPSLDVGYHFLAVVFYLSASVVLAYVTVLRGWGVRFATSVPFGTIVTILSADDLKNYRLDIAAVVMSYVATLLYFLHAIFSAIRWKRS
ncbi:myelin and lymphocyte protein isoform 1-T1 [Symphorus nematophorus]